MKKVVSAVASKMAASDGPAPAWIPGSLIQLIRRVSGGDDWNAQFVRGLLWSHRRSIFVIMICNAIVALTEGIAMGTIPLAFESLAKETGGLPIEHLGPPGQWVADTRRALTRGEFFAVLIAFGVGAQIMRSLTEFVSRMIAAHVSTSIEGRLRTSMFRQFLDMRFAEISRYKIGDLAAYLQQVSPVAGLAIALNEIVFQSLTILTYAVILMWLSWETTLIVIVATMLLMLFGRHVLRRIKSLAAVLIRAATALSEHTIELLGGVRHLHTYGREQFALERVQREIDNSMISRRKGLWWQASISPTMQTIVFLGVGIFLVGGLYVVEVQGYSTKAALIGFVAIVYRLLPRATAVNNKVANVLSRWPNVERVGSMLRRDDKQYVEHGTVPIERIEKGLSFRDVSLCYGERDEPAVSGLTFDVPAGTMTALVGPSGAGKSTVVNLLLRLYDPTDGDISVDGHALNDLRLGDWRSRIGLVDQEPFIFHSSVRENIGFAKLDATDEEISVAARAAAAHDFVCELPDGYDTVVGERGQRLSGGQRQRIAIARALVRRPSLLILDEATSALDSASERAIQEAIEGVRAEFTVVAIAHRLSTIAMADQILVLDGGRIVERGTHAELLDIDGLYARLWRVQAGEQSVRGQDA